MISLTIKDTKTFMSHLLIKDTFDNMLLSEAAIVTGNTYNINGSINRSFFSDDELHRKKLQEFVSESLAEKGIDAASLHRWARQIEELQVLRGLERLRPEWDDVLDGAEKWLYQGSEETYHKICEEFHKAYGSLGSHKEEWENLGEQLLMFFVYTYFCGAVYDDMVCSKMELALFSVRWIQEFLMVRWLENGKKLSMEDVEEISWRYAREVEHSDDNLNALEDWLFERYAPV